MKTAKSVTLAFVLGILSNSVWSEEDAKMTGDGLKTIIGEIAGEEVKDAGNVIEFVVEEVLLICIFDEAHDRMRIIAPVKSYAEVSLGEKDAMMNANFHGALDARYCVSGDILYSAFIHPLSSLRKLDVFSGIYQVASLQKSFGSEYSSGLLQFGGEEEKIERI